MEVKIKERERQSQRDSPREKKKKKDLEGDYQRLKKDDSHLNIFSNLNSFMNHFSFSSSRFGKVSGELKVSVGIIFPNILR